MEIEPKSEFFESIALYLTLTFSCLDVTNYFPKRIKNIVSRYRESQERDSGTLSPQSLRGNEMPRLCNHGKNNDDNAEAVIKVI